jgi:hypothetical protein
MRSERLPVVMAGSVKVTVAVVGRGPELDAADADLPEVEGDGAVGCGQGYLEV